MTDDEILAIANEVLVPAGLSATIRTAPRPEWGPPGIDPRSLEVKSPVEPPDNLHHRFYCGFGMPITPEVLRAKAEIMVDYIRETTATWPTPWVPANQAEG